MTGDNYAKHIARWIGLGALFLLPFTPLVVANPFFFPFITGKAFFSRILIEIAVGAWVALMLLDRAYRPRISWIGIVAIAFVAWMGIADLFALNVQKAFWSNFERMEGWVMLIHLLGLLFAASNILRVEKKWRMWFMVSLGASFIVSYWALGQLIPIVPVCVKGIGCAFVKLAIHQGSTRIDASLGNSAYLAIYLLFSVCVSLWMALTEERAWLKWSLIGLAVLEAVLIFFTETRGTIIGFVCAAGLSALLVLLTAGRKGRQWAGAGLIALVFLVGAFYVARTTPFVQNNHTLERVASISLSDGQTRFTLWHMAVEGAFERPLFGWGQEGFNYIFNKYFEPSLYGQESWFDRAHNAFIDWLVAGGFPAFLLYLGLFGTAIVLLWRSSELSRPERIAVTAALVGYAIHNVFVFDNLYSYIYFFALLGLIDSQVGKPMEKLQALSEVNETDGITYVLPVTAVVVFAVVWAVNVPGITVASKLITALSPSSEGVTKNMAAFKELIAHPAFGAQEIREQLVSFEGAVIDSPSIPDSDKQAAAMLAITEMQKQVTDYPLDAREHLELSLAYSAANDRANATKEIEAASALSPKKQEILIQVGAARLEGGDVAGAQVAFAKAYELAPQMKDLSPYGAASKILAGDVASADQILRTTLGTTTVDNNVLAFAYYQTKNWRRLAQIFEIRVRAPGAPIDTWFQLAAAYYAAGDSLSAIRTINEAVKRFPNDPNAAPSAAAALKKIQSGESLFQ